METIVIDSFNVSQHDISTEIAYISTGTLTLENIDEADENEVADCEDDCWSLVLYCVVIVALSKFEKDGRLREDDNEYLLTALNIGTKAQHDTIVCIIMENMGIFW